jgi:hypothetical protein
MTAKTRRYQMDSRTRRRPESRGMDIRIQCLCVDSPDPKKIASFWEAALSWRRTFDEDDQVCIEPPEGSPEDGIVPALFSCGFRRATGRSQKRLGLGAAPSHRAMRSRPPSVSQGVARQFAALQHARITAGPRRAWDEMLPVTSGQRAEGGAINV